MWNKYFDNRFLVSPTAFSLLLFNLTCNQKLALGKKENGNENANWNGFTFLCLRVSSQFQLKICVLLLYGPQKTAQTPHASETHVKPRFSLSNVFFRLTSMIWFRVVWFRSAITLINTARIPSSLKRAGKLICDENFQSSPSRSLTLWTFMMIEWGEIAFTDRQPKEAY